MGHLEDRIAEEVMIVLAEGDRDYLAGLSRNDLFDLLEREMRFLGVYTLDEPEAVQDARLFLDEHLDEWVEKFLRTAAQAVQYVSDVANIIPGDDEPEEAQATRHCGFGILTLTKEGFSV